MVEDGMRGVGVEDGMRDGDGKQQYMRRSSYCVSDIITQIIPKNNNSELCYKT